MHVGFLTSEFPHEKTGTAGGIGTSIMNLSRGLIKRGIKVSVLVYGQKTDTAFNFEGLEIIQVKNIKVKGLSRLLTQIKIRKDS
ncbi:MAG: hypothetical protein EOP06_16625 [Proteobacteria bacterium]|nr:MAG: hypothetical protein EOP06_16625 [Pseudomonadota bacterium]